LFEVISLQNWLILSDIPAQGRDFSFAENADWADILKEHGVEYKLGDRMILSLFVLPQSDGFLFTGNLNGALSLPCERCLRPVEVAVNRDFHVFEDLPGTTDTPLDSMLREISGHLELNIRHMMWEQFNLSLPVKVLCSQECRGICPECGKDLNEGECPLQRGKNRPPDGRVQTDKDILNIIKMRWI
jgi:uncharacterized protein